MALYGKVLQDSIEREKEGIGSTYYSLADQIILQEMLKEINKLKGTNYHYLAEIDTFNIIGAGSIMARYLPQFEGMTVKAYLIPQIVSDRVKECDKIILEQYLTFKASDEYIVPANETTPAHIYERYDNAFRRLKPRRLKNDLLALAESPIDVFYLPLTMKMLASWKIPRMKELLLQYIESSKFPPSVFGLIDGMDETTLRYRFMVRQMKFTAIGGLKYFPSVEVEEAICPLLESNDEDIRLAAQKTWKTLEKKRNS